jgi:hypothetical protein
MDPVMAAHAARVPRNTKAATPAKDTNLENRFMAPDLSNKNLWRDPKPNDDKRKPNDGKKRLLVILYGVKKCWPAREHAGLTR